MTQNGSDLWLSYWVSHQHHEEVELDRALGGFNTTAEQHMLYPKWQAMATFQPFRPISSCYLWPPQSGYMWDASGSPYAAAWINPKEIFRESNTSAGQRSKRSRDVNVEDVSRPAKVANSSMGSLEGLVEAHSPGALLSRRLEEAFRGEQRKDGKAESAGQGTRATGSGETSRASVDELQPGKGAVSSKGIGNGSEGVHGLGPSLSRSLKDAFKEEQSQDGPARHIKPDSTAVGAGGNSEHVDKPTSKGRMAEALAAVREYLNQQAARLRRGMRRSMAQLQPDVQFYLSVLLMLTLANSLSILVSPLYLATQRSRSYKMPCCTDTVGLSLQALASCKCPAFHPEDCEAPDVNMSYSHLGASDNDGNIKQAPMSLTFISR